MYSSLARQRLSRLLLSALFILAAASPLLVVSRPVGAQVTTIEVTNGNNSGPGSLRQAIENSPSGGTIIFAPAVNTITLTDDQLWIEKNLTIDGGGGVTIERSSAPGTRQFRIFEIASSVEVTLANLTIRNGSLIGGNGGGILNEGELTILRSTISNNTTRSSGGGIDNNRNGELWIEDSTISNNMITNSGNGGGINNNGDVTIINSSVTGNMSGSNGGGIASIGQSTDLIVIDSDISENAAPEWGGGIYSSEGEVTVTDSTLSRNSVGDNGGGIFNIGFLDVVNSTLSFNEARGDGGGIYNISTLDVVNSTISNNMADENGGGIYNLNTLHVFNSTIYENGAEMSGGGIVNIGPMVTLANTIVAGSTASEDYFGIGNNINLVLQGNNIVQDGSVRNVEAVDPLLGPLADNGGPTRTHLPQAGSRAINGGVNSVLPDDDADLDDDDDTDEQIPFDQRSLRRVVGGSVDIGAVEVGAGDVAYTVVVNPTSVDEGDSSDSATATVTITRSGATSTTSSVDVVLGGTANEGSDYTFALTSSGAHFDDGTLHFDPDTSVGTFTLMVQGDIVAESDETVSVMLANATALETATINVPHPVTLSITDDDVAGVTIDPVELTLSEAGQTDSYTVVLNTQPTANVTVTLTPDAQVRVAPTSLTFTPDTWNVPQPVTVSAVDDDVVEGAHSSTINHAVVSNDRNYDDLTIRDVTILILDDGIPDDDMIEEDMPDNDMPEDREDDDTTGDDMTDTGDDRNLPDNRSVYLPLIWR